MYNSFCILPLWCIFVWSLNKQILSVEKLRDCMYAVCVWFNEARGLVIIFMVIVQLEPTVDIILISYMMYLRWTALLFFILKLVYNNNCASISFPSKWWLIQELSWTVIYNNVCSCLTFIFCQGKACISIILSCNWDRTECLGWLSPVH